MEGVKKTQSNDFNSSLSIESEEERAQFIQNAKQLLNSKLEGEEQLRHIDDSQLEVRSIEEITEQDLSDKSFYYQGHKIEGLPSWLHDIDNFAQIIKQNASNIISNLNVLDKEKLCDLLPYHVKDKDRFFSQILRGDKIGQLGQSPLEQFSIKLQNKCFTKGFQKYQEYKKQLQAINHKVKIEQDINYLNSLIDLYEQMQENNVENIMSHLFTTRNLDNQEEGDFLSVSESDGSMLEEEKEIYNEMHAENDDLSSGYSTISSNKGELGFKKPNTLNQNNISQLHRLAMIAKTIQGNNEQAQLQKQEADAIGGSKNAKRGATLSSSKNEQSKGSIKRQPPQQVPPTPDFGIESIINSERFKSLKVHKNQVTLKKTSPEWIEIFRRQEEERYKHPTRPWVYFNEDWTTSIVGPVIKKKTGQTNQKPREHPQLLSNRPAIVTLLCLARDAASRLPDGVGTRADILELIKQSQWIKLEGTDPANLNSIVSGALDRLHYEPDPCVKYDSEKKLWIYLHKNRPIDWPDWQSSSRGERPNTLENNSLNPFAETEQEDMWKDTIHRERNTPYKVSIDDNENSESIESSTTNLANNKFVVKISIGGENQSTGHKRNFSSRGDHEESEPKYKRSKH